MRLSLFTIFVCIISLTFGQQFNLETSLDITVKETSGLLFLNNTLITHNDSGNTNQLFEIDTSTGVVLRTVTVVNATNIDWEDITHDETYIYIGDFGNFDGNRTDLKLYRISIADFFSNTSVMAQIINYSYSDQTDFTPRPLSNNYDAEALIHFNGQLYIFSKNWMDLKTNIYQLPKSIGTHSAVLIDTIDSDGLVTGATFNSNNESILLCGYDGIGPFLIQISAFNSGLFSNGIVTKTAVEPPTNYSAQIEGVAPINSSEYYVSSEEISSISQGLYSINLSTLNTIETNQTALTFSPNPTQNYITINKKNCTTSIYSITGQLVLTSTKKQIDISSITPGTYLVEIIDASGNKSALNKLIIE